MRQALVKLLRLLVTHLLGHNADEVRRGRAAATLVPSTFDLVCGGSTAPKEAIGEGRLKFLSHNSPLFSLVSDFLGVFGRQRTENGQQPLG